MTRRVALGLSWCVLVACAGPGEEVRRATYPPDFRYITDEELRGTMGRLARDVIALNEILARGEELTPGDRREVIRLLDDMRAASEALTAPGGSNHPILDANLSAFQESIDAAARDARRDPPSYYLAGSVAGACLYCHGRR